MFARLTCRAAHMSLAPRNHPGTPAHGLPAQTDAEMSFGTSAHGLPAFTDGVVFQRQPRPARLLCPPFAIVSVFHMFARLTCRRGSHVSDAEISFGTSVHGLPASTDADCSERQRTACPHYDSIISCGTLAYGLVSESLGPKKVKKVDSSEKLGCAHHEIWFAALMKVGVG